MLGIGLSLLGFGKNLLGWFMAGIKWLFAAWERVVIFVLLASVVWFWHGKASEARRADKMTVAAQKWEQAYNWMVIASEQNRKAQIALNKANTDKQTEIARLTDENQTNRVVMASRADDYARRMSAKGYCERQASPPAKSDIAQSGDRPGDDAVILSREDFDVLNRNTSRLVDAHQWGDNLIAAGLAERLGNVDTAPPPDE